MRRDLWQFLALVVLLLVLFLVTSLAMGDPAR